MNLYAGYTHACGGNGTDTPPADLYPEDWSLQFALHHLCAGCYCQCHSPNGLDINSPNGSFTIHGKPVSY